MEFLELGDDLVAELVLVALGVLFVDCLIGINHHILTVVREKSLYLGQVVDFEEEEDEECQALKCDS